MADGEDFTCDLKFAPDKFARRTEPALDLSRLKYGLLEFRVISAECIQFIREELRVLRRIASSSSQSLRRHVLLCVFDGPQSVVTDSVNGQKITRFLGNGFKLLTNADDMGIYRARGGEILVAPHFIEKAIAAQGFSGMTEEVLEQFKFLAREFYALPGPNNLIAAQIHFNVAKRIAVLFLRQRVRTPKNRLHACQEFPNGKGFRDVIVGSEFETHDFVDFLSSRRQHNDGNRRALGFELLAN